MCTVTVTDTAAPRPYRLTQGGLYIGSYSTEAAAQRGATRLLKRQAANRAACLAHNAAQHGRA